MKELSIKQKAKAYDEAFNRAKIYKENTDGVGAEDVSAIIEGIFPELQESEDEKIRKAIIEYIKTGTYHKSWIDWLEKQGEQKPAVIIPKFRVGDEIKTSNEESLTITKINEKGYWSEDLFICGFDEECIWDLVGQKPADKVKPKFKVGDYNPYKEVIESIAEMCEKYKLPTSNLSDFLDNVRVKCKEAKEYDSMFPQKHWKPSDEHYELEEFAKIVRGNLTGISKAVQELFKAKYLQLTGNKMYGGFKD